MKAVGTLRLVVLSILLLTTALLWAVNWQAKIIQDQNVRIHELQRDSMELLRIRMREQQEKRMKQALDHSKLTPQPGAALGCLAFSVCG
jgi:hypothetical protein